MHLYTVSSQPTFRSLSKHTRVYLLSVLPYLCVSALVHCSATTIVLF